MYYDYDSPAPFPLNSFTGWQERGQTNGKYIIVLDGCNRR